MLYFQAALLAKGANVFNYHDITIPTRKTHI